jgi:glycosyltransferase involved in cell wall biosynthesis
VHLLAPARHGGLESVVTMLASGQGSERAHIVAVLEPGDAANHPFVLRLEQLGIPATPLVVSARKYGAEYRALRSIIHELNPRLLHTHGYHADVIGGLAGRAYRIPSVSTVHGFVGGSRRNRFYELIQLLALRRADGVIAVSLPLVDRLVRAGVNSSKVHFVANGFIAKSSMLSRQSAREKLHLADGCRIAGWIGRLSPEKGPDVMVDAVVRCNPNWHVSMIGDGKARAALEERAVRLGIADRVVWHGAHSEAGTLMPAFDAFVLSSRTEGTPIALFEAMHAGIPIIATRVGGVPDVVSSREAIVVEPDSPGEIANALDSLISDPVAANERVKNARRKVSEAFGLTPWIEAVERVYEIAESSCEDRRRA